MKRWFEAVAEVTAWILGQPETVAQAVVPGLFGALTLLVALRFSSQAAGGYDAGWVRRACCVALLTATALAAAGAARAYAAPRLHASWMRLGVTVGLPVLAVLVLAVPVLMLLLHRRYGAMVGAVAISLFACAMVLLVTTAVMESVRGGNTSFLNVKRRTRSIDDFIGK